MKKVQSSYEWLCIFVLWLRKVFLVIFWLHQKNICRHRDLIFGNIDNIENKEHYISYEGKSTERNWNSKCVKGQYGLASKGQMNVSPTTK